MKPKKNKTENLKKKLKKTTRTTKITMIKQEKKIVKTHEEKKLNPALNHAAIIRKQKKLFDLPHIRTILNIRIE